MNTNRYAVSNIVRKNKHEWRPFVRPQDFASMGWRESNHAEQIVFHETRDTVPQGARFVIETSNIQRVRNDLGRPGYDQRLAQLGRSLAAAPYFKQGQLQTRQAPEGYVRILNHVDGVTCRAVGFSKTTGGSEVPTLFMVNTKTGEFRPHRLNTVNRRITDKGLQCDPTESLTKHHFTAALLAGQSIHIVLDSIVTVDAEAVLDEFFRREMWTVVGFNYQQLPPIEFDLPYNAETFDEVNTHLLTTMEINL